MMRLKGGKRGGNEGTRVKSRAASRAASPENVSLGNFPRTMREFSDQHS